MNIFAKFMYIEYIRPYVLSHVVSIIFTNDLTSGGGGQACQRDSLVAHLLDMSKTGFSFKWGLTCWSSPN